MNKVLWGVVFSLVLAPLAAFGQGPGPSTVGDRLSPAELATIEMTVIDSPPTPPPGYERPVVDLGKLPDKATGSLAVPTSTWTYGCTATSAGMIFGYYDRNGFPNLYTGPANGGVCPLTDLGQGISTPISGACSIIATQNGFDGRTSPGHADDYWVSYNATGPDPWESGGTEHTWGGCTADYLGTNQWKWDYNSDTAKDSNLDGATTYFSYNSNAKLYDYIPPSSYGTPQTEACHGMRLFAESRGYTVLTNYTQKIDTLYTGGFSFANFKTEIDSGYPVMVHVEGHTMVGVGYDDSTTPGTIYLNDTWDNLVHSMSWGGSYSGMAMKAVTVIHLQNVPPGQVQVTLGPAEAVTAGAQWTLDGGAWANSGAIMLSVTPGAHTVTFKPAAGWDTPPPQQITVNSGVLTTATGAYFHLGDGVGAGNRVWTTSGNADWFLQTAVSHDGWNALQSGDVGDSQSSALQTVVTGPVSVSFWWKVSSEQNVDVLNFYVNGGLNQQISGNVDWTQVTVALGAGANTLAWAYIKDSSLSVGSDAGWLDQFLVIESVPPAGTVSVNNGDWVTSDPNVLLALTYADGDGSGVSGMRFSNNGSTWSAWEKPAASKAWTLSAGEGYKTVRAQFRDKAGNVSAVASDYILADENPPTGTITINGGDAATASPSVTLGLTWDDGAGSGVSRMRFSNDGATWSAWEAVASTKLWALVPATPGYHTVRVQFRDRVGRVSDRFSDYIRLEP